MPSFASRGPGVRTPQLHPRAEHLPIWALNSIFCYISSMLRSQGRVLWSLLLLIPLAVPLEGVASAATVPAPTATCVDGNFHDGLDTRYAATYCTSALTAAGYAATARTQTDATPVLQQEATDAVFYHAGHALVVGDGNNATAIASVMPGAGTGGTFQGLLGDPAAATTKDLPRSAAMVSVRT